ncbi:MAG TPA: alpha/beta fold hydrolase [Chloroflexi bacterium]|nr:alpha/beta fold hydrolase [Chloroflexota bacterium]
MSAVIIESGLVHYEALGRGRPLILIHGWLGSWRYWVPTMDDLSDRYRTYALDLWGFGDSDRRQGGYTLSEYVAQVRRFMDEMGIVRAPLVGHALGGVVALRLAVESPERVEQVMGVSVPLDGTAVGRSLASFSGNGDDILARVLGRRQASEYPEVRLEARKADGLAVADTVRAVMQMDLRRDLALVSVPVLLVYGGHDPLIQRPEEKERRRRWDEEDNVRVICLEESRHFPMLDEMNKFNRLLRQFLDTSGDLSALEVKEEWRRRVR